MYKMSEVCERTGLTEKAIRVYMEQKLVEPKVEEGIHRKSYEFSEKDIERLKDVSALRNAGFSIAEIKKMLDNPVNISALAAEREAALAEEIRKKTAVQDALKHLTIQEHSDVAQLADAVEPRSTYAKESPKKRMSHKKKWFILLGILALLLLWLFWTGGEAGVFIPLMSFGLVFGVIAVLSAFRFILHSRKSMKMKCNGKGQITAIVSNENVETYIGKRERSMLKELLAYLAFGLFGEGIWENLRLDCWYPVIAYQNAEGQSYMATFRHGGFKKDWKVGEEVEIAWEEGKEQLVYPCNGQYLRKKAFAYFMSGLLMLSMAGMMASYLFAEKENGNVSESAKEEWLEKLELVENADRVTILCRNKLYELNEEEKEVLMTQFRELTIEDAKRHFGLTEGYTIRFYRGEEEIERYIIGDFFYITTGYGMRYKVTPVAVELGGTRIEDTTYITGFLLRFTEKMLLKQARAEMLEKIATMENVDDLKALLADEKYYDGADDLGNGYRFMMSEFGFQSYWGNPEDRLEDGNLRIRFNDDVMEAELDISYQTKDGSVETYVKQW